MNTKAKLPEMANAIRFLSMDAVQKANSGHPGLPMGAADIATVLFTEHMKFCPKDPNWADRDRFILSAGHGSMLLYSALYLLGYEDIGIEEIKNFRQLGSPTAGHPEYGHAAGIETTTGPLGQGIANAVGMALAEKKLRSEFGADIVDHHIYCLVGDGCLMEGISQEAISLAGHLRLNKLIVLWDDNNISIDGEISMSDSTDQIARFKASGWNTLRVDGHKPAEIAEALAEEEGLAPLNERHWAVIDFVRKDWGETGESPTLRRITKQSGVNTKELYALFPKGPAKKVARVAGLGKPKGCI